MEGDLTWGFEPDRERTEVAVDAGSIRRRGEARRARVNRIADRIVGLSALEHDVKLMNTRLVSCHVRNLSTHDLHHRAIREAGPLARPALQRMLLKMSTGARKTSELPGSAPPACGRAAASIATDPAGSPSVLLEAECRQNQGCSD